MYVVSHSYEYLELALRCGEVGFGSRIGEVVFCDLINNFIPGDCGDRADD